MIQGAGATNYAPWTYWCSLTVTPNGLNTGVTNFPLLVRLTSANANVFAQSLASGYDVRFTTADGTTDLPFQRERYVQSSQVAEFWVRVPSITTAPTQIRMYWGNPSATDVQSPATVFDTAAGGGAFCSIWHLDETGNNTAGGYKDATVHGVNGTGFNMVAGSTDTIGVIGTAQTFDGATQYITMGQNTTGISGNVPRTIEGWVKGNSTTAGAAAFGWVPNIGTTNSWYCINVLWNGSQYDLGFQNHDVSASTSPSDQTWHHIAGTYDGTTATLYIDGAQAGSGAPGALVTIDSFKVGMRGYTNLYFQGAIDEVRISKVARSADWVNLCYQTEQIGSTSVTFGPTQITPTTWPTPPVLLSPTNNAPNQASPVNFSWVSVTTATAYELQISASTSFSSTVYDNAALTSTSQAVSALTVGSTYYWHVQASNGSSWTGWSSAWSFGTALSAPTLASPTNGGTGLPISLSLTWSSSALATSYALLVASSSNFSSTVVSQTGLTGLSAAVSGLQNSTTYWWSVAASNATASSPWAGAWSFTTIGPPPNAPMLSAPGNGATVTGTGVTLSWSSAGSSYHVQLSTSSGFATTITDQAGLTTTTCAVTGLAVPATFFWRINATGSTGTGAWSSVWSFSTKATAVINALQKPMENELKVSGSMIGYSLNKSCAMTLSVFDILGRAVYSAHRFQSAGQYKVSLQSLNLAEGLYTVRFNAAGIEKSQRVLLSR
jgi:hypothetical protein